MKIATMASVGFSMIAAAALASQTGTESAPKESARAKSCCARKSAGEPMKCEKPAAAVTAGPAQHEGHSTNGDQKMRCSSTGKVVDTCCCVEREGKTHCTLANRDVAECCCTPVADAASVEDEKRASPRSN